MKRSSRASKHLDFIILDVICVVISCFLANLLRYNVIIHSYQTFLAMMAGVLVIHLLVGFATECYSGILRRNMGRELKYVLVHNLAILGMTTIFLFLLKQSASFSRVVFFSFFVINSSITFLIRTLRKKYLLKKGSHTGERPKMLLVADYETATKLVGKLLPYKYSNYELHGICVMDSDKVGEAIEGVPVVANKKSLYEYVCRNVIDEVFITGYIKKTGEITSHLYNMGVKVHISTNVFISEYANVTMGKVNGYSVLTAAMSNRTFRQNFMKRTMDICGAIVGLFFTGIIFLIFGPIIFIQSPGPIFFKQYRVGKNGRKFLIYKFRSMYPDAEVRKAELMAQNKMSGHMFKMDNDPRIIPIGRFMRKTSLDEFPQFWNVLKGEMSLVGTRPPTVEEYQQYNLHHRSRLAIKPGITGLWQISGRSDITDFEEVVKLDRTYIQSFSLSLDLKILFRTVLIVLGGKGAS